MDLSLDEAEEPLDFDLSLFFSDDFSLLALRLLERSFLADLLLLRLLDSLDLDRSLPPLDLLRLLRSRDRERPLLLSLGDLQQADYLLERSTKFIASAPS